MEEYLFFLNDLTDFECRVFFYSKVLKLPQDKTARYLNTNKVRINKICQELDRQKNLISLKEKILEAFLFND